MKPDEGDINQLKKKLVKSRIFPAVFCLKEPCSKRTSSSYWEMQTLFKIKVRVGLSETQNLLKAERFAKLGRR